MENKCSICGGERDDPKKSYCPQCRKNVYKEWVKKNPEKRRASQRNWKHGHYDKVREGKRIYRFRKKISKNKELKRLLEENKGLLRKLYGNQELLFFEENKMDRWQKRVYRELMEIFGENGLKELRGLLEREPWAEVYRHIFGGHKR